MTRIIELSPQLIRDAERGSRTAQMQLYDQHFSKTYTTIYHLIGNQMDAEDIVHDSFIDAFQKLHQLEDPKKFGPWIKRIAINKTMARFRSASNKTEVQLEEDSDLTEQENETFIWEQFKIEDIMRAIRKLPHGYCQVICLHLLEDMKHEEIAETLGITASASRSQYMRARKKLKEYLSQHYGRAKEII